MTFLISNRLLLITYKIRCYLYLFNPQVIQASYYNFINLGIAKLKVCDNLVRILRFFFAILRKKGIFLSEGVVVRVQEMMFMHFGK